MQKSTKYTIVIFFTIVFMALISAPTIIMSIDDSVDISCFFSITEEEENTNVKILFDKDLDYSDDFMVLTMRSNSIGYAFKTYPKPHLNLIFPPPELS